MAKKKAAPKKRTRFDAVRKGSKKAKSRATSPKPPKRAPRQPALGGIGDLRIKPLDRVCVAIAEVRGDINNLRAEEGGLLRQALSEMRSARKQTYRHAGVELARVPGEERLRVRTTKGEDATAETEETGDLGAGSPSFEDYEGPDNPNEDGEGDARREAMLDKVDDEVPF